MNAPLTDDALDRVAAATASVPTPFDADPSDYAWKSARSALLRLTDGLLVYRAQNETDEGRFDRWVARQLREAIQSESKDPDLAAIVDALYDDEQELMAEEAQRDDDEFQRAGGFDA